MVVVSQTGICASGCQNRVTKGKHFNRALRVHKLVFEALQRLLKIRFVEMIQQFELLSQETQNMLMDLGKENISTIKDSKNSKPTFRSTAYSH